MAQFNEWSELLERELSAPFPADVVQQKNVQGGGKISYVPWDAYVARLNALVGCGWSNPVPTVLHISEKIIICAPVTILGVTRCNVGDEDDDEFEEVLDQQTGEMKEKRTMYGSPSTNAMAQALKRTCALFGMGLEFYDKKKKRQQAQAQAQQQRPQQAPAQQQPNPQLEAMRARCAVKMTAAAERMLLTDDEATRLEGAIASGDPRRIENAMRWLDDRLTPAKLGAT